MPNPTLIAQQEEAVSEQRLMNAPVEVKTYQVVKMSDTQVLEQQQARIVELETHLHEANLAVDRLIREANDTYVTRSLQSGEFKSQIHTLKQSLAILGKDLLEMTESRDRLQKATSEMSPQIRELKKIAKAADRYLASEARFMGDSVPTDAQTQEAAEAHCELEMLLEQHGALFK